MMKSKIVDAAVRVLQVEAVALEQLSRELPVDFSAVIEAILKTQGRIIVSGVGKSGHVGRKIASTLASTGTPAYFVHATEASHGDLGMVTDADFCLLISNSGETAELSDVVAHSRRFSIPLAAISSKPDSTLMRAADYKLCLPNVPEACHIGMAPTTSTTLTLALGDALAVTLMELRNFQHEEFRVFHPGGNLGAKLATVKQLMHKDDAVPVVDAALSMQDTLIYMTSKGFGITAVCSDDRLIGVISDGDLRRHMHHLLDKTAGEIASRHPVCITEDEFAAQALKVMNEQKVIALVVVDEIKIPIGILHIHDLIRAGVV